MLLPNYRTFVTAALVSVAAAAPAVGQPMAVEVEVDAQRTFVPLQSYALGRVGSDVVFFAGLREMGLHVFGAGAFPVKMYNDEIVVVDETDGTVHVGGTSHLPSSIRHALLMTAPSFVEFDDVLYVYGGYGPDGESWSTRPTVTAIDLAAVRNAIKSGQNAPASAFSVLPCPAGQSTGGWITKLDGDRFVLFGGTNFTGEYAGVDEVNEYTDRAYIFDRTVSLTEPIETFFEDVPFESPLHRRDVNLFPVTMPDGGGTRPGFAVCTGAFQNGSFLWVNPLIWGDGDASISMDESFVQHLSNYTTARASFYSEATGENLLLLFSGISAYEYENGEFIESYFGPWTDEINVLTVAGGAFRGESIVGVMPWPLCNADLELDPSLPTNAAGQVLTDQLPKGEPVFLGRIYGGIAAEQAGDFPPTAASDRVYNVSITLPDDSVPADLTDFMVEYGSHLSGGLVELGSSDNAYLRARSRLGFTAFEPNLMRLRVGAHTDVVGPTSLDLDVECKINHPSGTCRLSLRAWPGGFDNVATYQVGTSDLEYGLSDLNATEYVRASDGRIELQVRHVVVATFTALGFDSSFDLVEFRVR